MKIHEYQARELLSQSGIPVPAGAVIQTADQAADAYALVTKAAATDLAVVKAQVFAGGRGKAGFVKLVRNADDATAAAEFMFNNRMVSNQTGPDGLAVSKLLVAAGVDIADRPAPRVPGGVTKEEYYLAITTDRNTRRNVMMASAEGGMDIETVAAENPSALIKTFIDPLTGLQPHQAREVAFRLGMHGKQINQAVKLMLNLAKLYESQDCTMAEINPLIITSPADGYPDGQVMAIDAKFQFDDNAVFRHKNQQEMHDPSEDNPLEVRAAEHDLNYIALDGNIGCLVNGAGLAMATMDIIKHAGGEPANFLDVGGSASEEAVTEAFRIILSDDAVKGIMVNIFGGIMDCAVIARGVVNAAREVGFTVPLVVRLEGTNVDAGRKILAEASADLPTLQAAADLADAAEKVVGAVKQPVG
ncbi:MAG: succinate--CoA ligase [ADP-forming] subunit beta [Phycisphaeraceae bacterium]|nr:MAG: succinate--CoA ligase [ADP-forming] subunit beta [Phycisphaeraceae bacterium]